MSKCRVLDETVTINPIVIYFRKNHFLVESINTKLGQMKSAGLIQLFKSMYTGKNLKSVFGGRKPKVLTLYDLSGVLEVWMFSLVLATSVFIVEVFVKKCESLFRPKN
jgi:hypothetical protein